MPKKSKVKKIPAKVGAKATTKSGDKVEVVLNTTKIVKDKTRGKYKPRKKTRKKKEEKDALSLLREKIELEKLQALQQAQRFEVPQRSQNRRTGGDISQYFGKQNDGRTKEAVGDLSKQVKSLREELRKSKEVKPVEEVKEDEPKSKFKEELETTQNEIQRQRIQRGIERRDRDQIRKSDQRRVDDFEKIENQNRLRNERGREAIRKERSVNQQAKAKNIEQFEEREKERRNKTIRQERTKQKSVEERLTEREQLNDLRKAITKEDKRRESLKPPTKEITPVRVVSEPRQSDQPKQTKQTKQTKQPNLENVQDDIDDIGKRLIQQLQKEETQEKQTIRNPRTPTQETKTIQEVSKSIINTLDNDPLLNRERQRQRESTSKPSPPRVRSIRETLSEQKKLADKKKLETFIDKSKSQLEDPTDESDFESDGEVFDDVQEDERTPRTKRRESFLEETSTPEVEQKIEKQSVKDKLQEEAQILRELQESGDKAFANRQQAQIQIETDERVARDIILQQARAKDFELATSGVDDMMRKLKDDKQREKKKARDNLRKREDQEFLDNVAGDIISGSIDEAQRKRKSKSVIETALGRGLANEIITATQNIPRSSGRFSQAKTDETIAELLVEKKLASYTRKAYELDEAKEKINNQRQSSDLKEKLVLAFPKIIKQSDYSKEMTAKQLNNRVREHVKQAKESGEYSGIKLVQLQTLLERLVEKLIAIKFIEQAKRDRRGGGGGAETEEQRQTRIRQAERDAENRGGASGDSSTDSD